MLLPLLFAFPLLSPAQSSLLPEIELKDFGGASGLRARFAGRDLDVAFETRWPDSYLVGDATLAGTVEVGGKEFATAVFNPIRKEAVHEGAQAVFGMEVLGKVCLAFDPTFRRMERLPRTKIGLAGAKAYFSKLPAWGDAPVVRLPLGRTEDGTPTIEATIAGRKTPLVFSLSVYDTSFGKTIPRPKDAMGGDGWSYLPDVDYPGLRNRWLEYAPDPEWDAKEEGAGGVVALDAYLSRRVIVDLADRAAYVEGLDSDAQLSLFLAQRATLPLIVKGDGATIAPMPGLVDADKLGFLSGHRVVSIAGIPIEDWLKLLRSATPDAAERLAKNQNRLYDDFEVALVGPDGTKQRITVPRRERPSETLVPRADGTAGWSAGSPRRQALQTRPWERR